MMNADVLRLTPAAVRGDLDAMAQIVASIAREHTITITVNRAARPHAFVADRRIVVPPIERPEDFAGALHELAHVVVGPCRGGLHAVDRSVRSLHCCLYCESRAWDLAYAWFPFTARMYARARQCIDSYRRTPAPPAAVEEFQRVRGSVAWAASRRRHVGMADFAAKRTLVERWQRQIADRRREMNDGT